MNRRTSKLESKPRLLTQTTHPLPSRASRFPRPRPPPQRSRAALSLHRLDTEPPYSPLADVPPRTRRARRAHCRLAPCPLSAARSCARAAFSPSLTGINSISSHRLMVLHKAPATAPEGTHGGARLGRRSRQRRSRQASPRRHNPVTRSSKPAFGARMRKVRWVCLNHIFSPWNPLRGGWGHTTRLFPADYAYTPCPISNHYGAPRPQTGSRLALARARDCTLDHQEST